MNCGKKQRGGQRLCRAQALVWVTDGCSRRTQSPALASSRMRERPADQVHGCAPNLPVAAPTLHVGAQRRVRANNGSDMRGLTGGRLRAIPVASRDQQGKCTQHPTTRRVPVTGAPRLHIHGGGRRAGGSPALLCCWLRPGGKGHHEGLRGSIAVFSSRGQARARDMHATASYDVGSWEKQGGAVSPRVWASARRSRLRWVLRGAQRRTC